MKKYTLVVVDMQSWFRESLDERIIANVEREIKAAVARGCDIVVTEIPYWSPMDEKPFPPTHRQLMSHLRNYKDHQVVEKLMWQDGVTNVLNACEGKGFGTKRLRFCGVRTGGWVRNDKGEIEHDECSNEPRLTGCVFALVHGLAKARPDCRIDVVQDACNDSLPVNWDDYRQIPNVAVLPGGSDGDEKAA